MVLFSCPDVVAAAGWWESLWTSLSLLIWYIAGGFCLWLPIWLLAPGSKIIISFPNERLWITAVNYQMIIKNIYCLLRFEETAHSCCLAYSSGPQHQPMYMFPLRTNCDFTAHANEMGMKRVQDTTYSHQDTPWVLPILAWCWAQIISVWETFKHLQLLW